MKKVLFIIILFCFGYKQQSKEPVVNISLVDSNHSVKFSGLDFAVISEINRDSVQDAWRGLLPVFKMPADTDLKDYQPVQPGVYRLKDSAVVFTPDTPFDKGKTYFMRYYRFDKNGGVMDFIKGKKKLRETPYIDLIF